MTATERGAKKASIERLGPVPTTFAEVRCCWVNLLSFPSF